MMFLATDCPSIHCIHHFRNTVMAGRKRHIGYNSKQMTTTAQHAKRHRKKRRRCILSVTQIKYPTAKNATGKTEECEGQRRSQACWLSVYRPTKHSSTATTVLSLPVTAPHNSTRNRLFCCASGETQFFSDFLEI